MIFLHPLCSGGGRKMFFSEEKNQKTFATWAEPIRTGRRQIDKSFRFFLKKKIFLDLPKLFDGRIVRSPNLPA
jgi:hypothetical protein